MEKKYDSGEYMGKKYELYMWLSIHMRKFIEVKTFKEVKLLIA